MKTILSLCDLSGAWPKPYADNGFEVISLDLQNGDDVRLFDLRDLSPMNVVGVLAAPPCTEFAVSGARWWADKGEEPLLEGLAVVDACLRIIQAVNPKFWALENPVGRLRNYIGPWAYSFDPCDFGDPYTKKTLLWGNFKHPTKARVEPTQGSKMHRLPPSADRAQLRSVTPPGFANAFYAANRCDE